MNAKLRDIAHKSEFISLMLIVLLVIAFSIANPAFFNIINIFDLLKICAYPTLFACGVMIVLISATATSLTLVPVGPVMIRPPDLSSAW